MANSGQDYGQLETLTNETATLLEATRMDASTGDNRKINELNAADQELSPPQPTIIAGHKQFAKILRNGRPNIF